jgi:hypothetical protein
LLALLDPDAVTGEARGANAVAASQHRQRAAMTLRQDGAPDLFWSGHRTLDPAPAKRIAFADNQPRLAAGHRPAPACENEA